MPLHPLNHSTPTNTAMRIRVTHPDELIRKELSVVESFNERLATRLGNVLTSVWFFWFCVLLDIFVLPSVIQAHSVMAWVTYASQTVIQLVSLPILGFLSNVIQRDSEAKSEADHLTMTEMAKAIDEIRSLLTK